jgi:uncharacterized protein HemX
MNSDTETQQGTERSPSVNQVGPPRFSRHLRGPGGIVLLLVSVLALSIAYYFAISLPNHNRALLELEREKFMAAQEEKQMAGKEEALKELDTQIDAATREIQLHTCIDKAEAAYKTYVKLNGNEVPGKKGVYTAGRVIWDSAAKAKNEALEECHRQWDPR